MPSSSMTWPTVITFALRISNDANKILTPIRKKRKYYEENIDLVKEILKKGTEEAKNDASKTLDKVKKAIGIDYFE